MNQNSELLMYIYQNSEMGVKSSTKLLNIIKKKENKIKIIIEAFLKEYERYYKESSNLLKKKKLKPEKNSILINLTSNTAMTMELSKDNSDAKVADILTRGFTMGVIDLTKKIDSYKETVDKDILKLAKKSLKFQQTAINILKEYL